MTHSLGILEAIVLGIIQGITEFLPISSDGHLALGAMWFGLKDMTLSFEVTLHIGTLLATMIVFRNDLRELLVETARGISKPKEYFATNEGKLLLSLVVATIPTGVIGLLLNHRVESWSSVKWIVGLGFIGSALAVSTTKWARGDKEILALGPSILVGLFQGLAVLPGLSRSGSTIACAMLLGLSGPAAFRYSFLLSLPAIGGAVLLKTLHPGALDGLGVQALVGTIVSFVVGLFALTLLRGVVSRGKIWVFAFYLVPLGLLLIGWNLISTS